MKPSMRPGQLTPNELEVAILERLAAKEPSIRVHLDGLHVLSRQFTGVGSFTTFKCDEAKVGGPQLQVVLDAFINLPDVANGMGAVLFCRRGEPECLEVFTYGDDRWDGVYAGFSIE